VLAGTVLFSLPLWAQTPERAALRQEYEAAVAAHARKDYPEFLARSRKVAELAPRSSRALYNLACAYSLTGGKAEAIRLLRRIADLGVAFDLTADPDLQSLRDSPEFSAVQQHMESLNRPVGESAIAFTLPERDLITEGVAHDPTTGAFFVSSVHRRKVLRIARDGRVTDLVKEGQDDLFSAIGLGLDAERRSLFVSTEAQPAMRGFRKEDEGRSFVYEFDLDHGSLRRRIGPPVEGGHLSDLTVGPGGDLFVSDPQSGRIYVLRRGRKEFEVLIEAGPITSAQGLTFSPDGSTLFVADYGQGIVRVDPKARTATLLDGPEDALLTGIDGLAFAGDSLIGIQNGVKPHRVVRLRLNAAASRIEEVSILERANPHFDEPTLGVVVGRAFFFVANSQYALVGDDGTLDEDKLKNPVILRTPLPWLTGS
jgi:sugar lactone lactonase YvrE